MNNGTGQDGLGTSDEGGQQGQPDHGQHPEDFNCQTGTSVTNPGGSQAASKCAQAKSCRPVSVDRSARFARDVGDASRSLTKTISHLIGSGVHLSADELTKLDGLDVIVGRYLRARGFSIRSAE